MEKVLDIKLDRIEKEIRSLIVSYKSNNQTKKVKYSIYNQDIEKVITDIQNSLQQEEKDLMDANAPEKFWLSMSKAGFALGFLYFMIIVLTVSRPSLMTFIPLIISLIPSIVEMNVGNKQNIEREQKVLDMLKEIDKVNDFIKVKGIHKVRVIKNNLKNKIQKSADKTISKVKTFSDDIFVGTFDEIKTDNKPIQISKEKLIEFREQLKKQIQEDDFNKQIPVDESLDRLDEIVSNSEYERRGGKR